MMKTRWDGHRSWISAIVLIGVSLGWLLLPSEPQAQSPALIEAVNDTATTATGTPVTISVLANDRGTGLSILQVDNPAQGVAVISGDTVIYTPNAGFAGTDVFGYTISDGISLDSATVIVTVNPPPPPVLRCGSRYRRFARDRSRCL